jgi:hypothetical protein
MSDFNVFQNAVHHRDVSGTNPITTSAFVGECIVCGKQAVLLQQSWDSHVVAMQSRNMLIEEVPALCFACHGGPAAITRQA